MDERDKREMNLKRLEVFHQSLYDSVFERYKLLPQISALSATLLVVATFNKKLVPLTSCVRVSLIILLALIPISLIGYVWELKHTEEYSSENIKRLGDGRETILQGRNLFTAYLPWFVTAVISVVIVFIILSVLNNLKNSSQTNPEPYIRTDNPTKTRSFLDNGEEDKDCKDFRTQREAQSFFEANGGPSEDPHNLDRNGDGRACESLP